MRSSRWRNFLCFGAAPFLIAATLATAAKAGPIFEWVCDAANCNGDPSFNFTIEFANGVVGPNASFTGIAGNVLGATLTSGLGAGFTLTLADLLEGGGNINDQSNFYVLFDATGTQVQDLLDASLGTNLTFANATGARADIFEGTNFNYSIGSLNDGSGFFDIVILGRLVLSTVPEPATLALFGGGLVGLAVIRRRRKAKSVRVIFPRSRLSERTAAFPNSSRSEGRTRTLLVGTAGYRPTAVMAA